MYRYMDKFKILYQLHKVFQPNHNTNQPLIHLMDKIYKSLNKDNPEYKLGIFLDLKKAFNTVNINILLQKLKHYGFKGASNTWVQNYLTNRTQYVCINEIFSSSKDISCGVPQGSVLGSLLFWDLHCFLFT